MLAPTKPTMRLCRFEPHLMVREVLCPVVLFVTEYWQLPSPICACAGPTTADQLVMLDLCVDALKATAVISEHRMQTLDSAMHNLRTLIQLQAAVTEVHYHLQLWFLKNPRCCSFLCVFQTCSCCTWQSLCCGVYSMASRPAVLS